MKVNFSVFPALETSRLSLRRLSLADAQAIYQLRSDEEVARMTGNNPFKSIYEATAYIQKIERLMEENACMFWAISYKGEFDLIGAICFWNFDMDRNSIEIGYELLPEFRQKGIMVEGIAAVIKFGFEYMAAGTITAFPSANNLASVNILQKLNFKLVPDTLQHSHQNVEGMLTYILCHTEP